MCESFNKRVCAKPALVWANARAPSVGSVFARDFALLEQRLALYLSKMFASQQVHRRFEDDIYGALPIEGAAANKRRQTLREAADGLIQKGFPNLARFDLQRSPKTGRWLASFYRAGKVAQEAPVRAPSMDRIPEQIRPLVEDIVAQTNDPGSIPMWVRAIRGLGEEAVRFALADLRAEQLQRRAGSEGSIKNPGAWLTTKLMATKSTPARTPNARSALSLLVSPEAGSGTPGALIPLCSPSTPPSTTTLRICWRSLDSTRSSIRPSSSSSVSPGFTSDGRYS